MARKKRIDSELESEYIDLVDSGGGRPRKILNQKGKETVRNLAAILCTDEEIASVLGITTDTLTNRYNGEVFANCKKEGQNKGKVSLRRMQYKSAEAGNVSMQIWLGKQYLGQKEQQEVEVADSNITFNIAPATTRPHED